MLTGFLAKDRILLVVQALIDPCSLSTLSQHHQRLCPYLFNMVISLIGGHLDAVGIEQSLRRIAFGHIVTGLHLIIMVETESPVDQTGVMCSRIKGQFCIIEFIQSDKGSCTRQITCMPAFTHLSHFHLADLAMKKRKPFFCQL